jgi:zinc D-Ala-D-Ala carboxypeptidase
LNWRYFKLEEFSCQHCGQNHIDHQFVTELDELRHRFGKPLRVTSGYRCPEHNDKVSSTGKNGPHTTGRACDFAVSHANAYHLILVAASLHFTGIGVNQKGSGRFIHVDNLPNAVGQPRPTIWSY